MAEVKDQRITNETVGKKLFDIPNIKKQIATGHLTFIGKAAHNSDKHITTKLLNACYNQKNRRGGVLNTKKKFIVHNVCLIIPGVEKPER